MTTNLIRKRQRRARINLDPSVLHDVQESFAIAVYFYFLSKGIIAAQGTPAEMRTSDDPYMRQFVHALM